MNNLYTNYLLYGGVETVGFGLTFRGRSSNRLLELEEKEKCK